MYICHKNQVPFLQRFDLILIGAQILLNFAPPLNALNVNPLHLQVILVFVFVFVLVFVFLYFCIFCARSSCQPPAQSASICVSIFLSLSICARSSCEPFAPASICVFVCFARALAVNPVHLQVLRKIKTHNPGCRRRSQPGRKFNTDLFLPAVSLRQGWFQTFF